MARRIFDTNILISHWRRTFLGRDPRQIAEKDAVACARKLIDDWRVNAILSPVYVEYLCGTRNDREIRTARLYLDEFDIVDEGRILRDDWEESKRIAARVLREGTPRQMGDCLIRAICNRLNLDVYTADVRFPR